MKQVILKTPISGADLVKQINENDTQLFNKIEEEMPNTKPFLGQFMDTVGDGTGSINMNVDGSTLKKTFLIKPPSGVKYMISRLIFSLRDRGSLDSGGWGNNGGIPLTNGLGLILHKDGVGYDMIKHKLKSHYDLASVDYDVASHFWGSGDPFLVSRFTFTKGGVYVLLDGDKEDSLSVEINDDLTYLTDQRISVQGYIDI